MVDQWEQNFEMKKVYDFALLLVAQTVRWRVLYWAKRQGKEKAKWLAGKWAGKKVHSRVDSLVWSWAAQRARQSG